MRWGSEGHINLIGTLSLEGSEASQRLEYSMVEGPCRSAEVVAYLDALAEEVVVVLDNAPFHTAGMVKEKRPFWEGRGTHSALSAGVLCGSQPHPTSVA